jgi:hypothetical protein
MKVLCSIRTLVLIAAWSGVFGVIIGVVLTQLAARR